MTERVVTELTASEYFRGLKANKREATDEMLSNIYSNCLSLFDKYERTGQMDAIKKLYVHLEAIEKEHKAIAAGVNLFVYLADVKPLLDRADSRVIRCIDLHKYEREIPDEVVAKYEQVKDIFDRFVVMFTDYTQEHSKKIAKEREPILFGVFHNDSTNTTVERLYFIGDWEDEYCDLTLDRLVSESRKLKGNDAKVYEITDPVDLKQLRERIKALEEEKRKGKVQTGSGGITLVNSLTNNNSYQALSLAVNSAGTGTGIILPVSVPQTPPDAENSTAPSPIPAPAPTRAKWLDRVLSLAKFWKK